MMFLLEAHSCRGFTIKVTGSHITFRLFFLTMSAAATTFHDQINTHVQDACAEAVANTATRLIDDIAKHGRDGLIDEVNDALGEANRAKMSESKELVDQLRKMLLEAENGK